MSRCGALVVAFLIAGMSLAGVGLGASGKEEFRSPRPSVSELEQRVFEAVNQERERHGLAPLLWARDLGAVAREHSRDMMARNYFAHQSPEGEDLRRRLARHGIHRWRVIAENLAYNSGYRDPVAAAIEGWMRSPGHRHNILDKRLSETGIGVSLDDAGQAYFAQVFATREQGIVERRRVSSDLKAESFSSVVALRQAGITLALAADPHIVSPDLPLELF
jgi:uncharacterized protein YkwD